MKQHDITEYIKAELNQEKRCVISGLGVFELIPARKGKHFNMHTRVWEETKRKYRIRFKQSPVLKEWLKTLE